MSVRFVDNFHAALSVGIDSVATNISFAAGTGDIFRDKLGAPLSTDHIYGTLFNAGGDIEIVKITATADDDFTIVRAQGVTTARAWLAGDVLSCRPCAPALSEAVSLPTDLARSGINIDITEIRGLTTPLSAAQGGTGFATLPELYTALGIATAISAAVSAHTAAEDPHPGYVLNAELLAAVPSQTGNSGKFLTTNGTTTSWATAEVGVGSGQTWQNMSSSRLVGTVYQNTTGKPIMVSAVDTAGASNVSVGATASPSTVTAGTVVVPDLWYYTLPTNGGATVSIWAELRS